MSTDKTPARFGGTHQVKFELSQEHPSDAEELEMLLDQALGPDRMNKPAHRLREGLDPVAELSLTARVDGALKGAIRYSPVTIGDAKTPALLLGPLAVDPALRGAGIGIALMTESLLSARQMGHRIVVLVGDEPYYSRVGFSVAAGQKLLIPGQTDQSRVLALELAEGALVAAEGTLKAAPGNTRFSNN